MRAALVAAVAASALLLTGCASTVRPPAGPSEDEIRAFTIESIHFTWQRLNLIGDYSEPTIVDTPPLESIGDWNTDISACMSDAGYSDFSWGWDGTAFTFTFDDNREADNRSQLTWFGCVVAHPLDPVSVGYVASSAQLSYLYDYYARQVVPCLVLHGYSLSKAPSRQAFVSAAGFSWNPYLAVTNVPQNDRVSVGYEQMVAECGAPLGLITSVTS